MATDKKSRKLITDMVIIVLVLLCVGLILTEMIGNVSIELATESQTQTTTVETPTPYPTLTPEELKESLTQPVN
jgi:hypothetical protein